MCLELLLKDGASPNLQVRQLTGCLIEVNHLGSYLIISISVLFATIQNYMNFANEETSEKP